MPPRLTTPTPNPSPQGGGEQSEAAAAPGFLLGRSEAVPDLIERPLGGAVEAAIAARGRLIREGNGTAFVVRRVRPTEAAPFRRNFDASFCRDRFRTALLGANP